MKRYFFIFLWIVVMGACKNPPADDTAVENENVITQPKAVSINYTLTATFPHDTTCFTEGLFIHDGKLFESSGAPDYLKQTRSIFGIVNLNTGKIDVKGELDRNKYFGEGIAILNNKLFQLTYENRVGFIYDATNFRNLGQFSYRNKEGWGLTTDGKQLIMSDGTSDLTYLDAGNQNFIKTLNVNTINYDLPDQLNELEYINGFIYANVWRTNTIVKIDPSTGEITGLVNLTALANKAKSKYKNCLEMNGIAYDSVSKKIYISGKMWPEIYQVEFPL